MIFEHESWTLQGWEQSTDPKYPHFAHTDGREVLATRLRERFDHNELQAVLGEDTDAQGWSYGQVFRKIGERRPGGRAKPWAWDVVRRRRWAPPSFGDGTCSPAGGEAQWEGDSACLVIRDDSSSSLSNAPAPSGTLRRSGTALEQSDWEAIRKLLQLLQTYCGKRHPSDWISVVADPTVGFRVMRQHGEAYNQALEAACIPIHDNGADHAELLADAARAAVFSCAVYGMPMLEGHLDSVAAFAGGAAAHNAGVWTAPEHSTAFLRLAGLRADTLLLSSWNERTYEPAFCLAWDHKRRWLVLAVRGTVDWRAILTDASAHVVPVCGGATHEGMLLSARFVIGRCLPLLRNSLRDEPDYELVCTGHSMGAGAGVLIALLLRSGEGLTEEDPPALRRARAYGIGTPPLLTHELAEDSVQWAVTVERGMDFISRLSLFAMDRFLFELTNASVAKLATDWLMKTVGSRDTQSMRFQRTFGEDKVVAELLEVPGRIVHLDTRRTAVDQGSNGSKVRRPRDAYFAPSLFYQRYMLGLSMLADHIPREYYIDISLVAAQAAEASRAKAATLSTNVDEFIDLAGSRKEESAGAAAAAPTAAAAAPPAPAPAGPYPSSGSSSSSTGGRGPVAQSAGGCKVGLQAAQPAATACVALVELKEFLDVPRKQSQGAAASTAAVAPAPAKPAAAAAAAATPESWE